MELNHSNLFHDALTKVHDIAKNGIRNNQSWHDVLDIVDSALNEARRLDREVDNKWPKPILTESNIAALCGGGQGRPRR